MTSSENRCPPRIKSGASFSGSCTSKKAVECPIPSSSISAGRRAPRRQPRVTLRAQRNLRSNSPSITGSTTSRGSGAHFEQSADCTAFQSFDWLAAWCEHIGSLTRAQPAIVVGRQAGEVLFILPLAVMPGAVRRLTWLGSDMCDYNGPLLATACASQLTPERFRELWREICGRLQSDARTRHDLVELSKMPERVGGQGGQANPFMALSTNLNPSNAYVTDLFGTWDRVSTTPSDRPRPAGATAASSSGLARSARCVSSRRRIAVRSSVPSTR